MKHTLVIVVVFAGKLTAVFRLCAQTVPTEEETCDPEEEICNVSRQ